MFDIFTDSSSNLTSDNSDSLGIKIISYTCEIGGAEMLCYDENRPFEDTAREYYTKMRAGADVRTTLISAGRLSDAFEPSLKAGRDVLFVGMSSGLTGTLQAAKMAASSLSEKYPNVRCEVCDSFAASLGEGLMVIRVAEMRKSGVSLDGALSWLEQNKMSMSQVFTVDDLKYLRRGGRISGIAALVGNLLHVKPILRATNAGTIGLFSKTLGRRHHPFLRPLHRRPRRPRHRRAVFLLHRQRIKKPRKCVLCAHFRFFFRFIKPDGALRSLEGVFFAK
jgi:DegV family protein with EDD domain